jgi:hypothetical protein
MQKNIIEKHPQEYQKVITIEEQLKGIGSDWR